MLPRISRLRSWRLPSISDIPLPDGFATIQAGIRYNDTERYARLLMPASAMQFALFGTLTWWICKHNYIAIDHRITHILQKRMAVPLQRSAKVVSFLGKAFFVNGSAVPIAFFLWKRHLRLDAAMLVGCCAINLLFKSIVQPLVDRPRPAPPEVRVLEQPRGQSFPSGHVSASVTFWAWVIALGIVYSQGKRRWWRPLIAFPALLLALIGPARVYLGDHWASDVVGGYLLGGGWFTLSLRLYLALSSRKG